MHTGVIPEPVTVATKPYAPLYTAKFTKPKLTHIEARKIVVNSNGKYGRLVQPISDTIVETVGVSVLQAQIIEQMLLNLIHKAYDTTEYFWYVVSTMSLQMWNIEQDARRILGSNIGVFMKDSPQNFLQLKRVLNTIGSNTKYLATQYSIYHAFVLDPIYSLSASCQIPAWIPVDNDPNAKRKIMFYCVIQLYPRIFYEDHQQRIYWRKGGILIEPMTYDDTQGVWFRTLEGNKKAAKIELAWYETY